MTSFDPARLEQPKTRWFRRLSAGFVVIVALIGGVLSARANVRNYVTYRFETHTGTPTVIAAAVPPTIRDEPPIRLAMAGDVSAGGDDEYRTAAVMNRLEGAVEYDGNHDALNGTGSN